MWCNPTLSENSKIAAENFVEAGSAIRMTTTVGARYWQSNYWRANKINYLEYLVVKNRT